MVLVALGALGSFNVDNGAIGGHSDCLARVLTAVGNQFVISRAGLAGVFGLIGGAVYGGGHSFAKNFAGKEESVVALGTLVVIRVVSAIGNSGGHFCAGSVCQEKSYFTSCTLEIFVMSNTSINSGWVRNTVVRSCI